MKIYKNGQPICSSSKSDVTAASVYPNINTVEDLNNLTDGLDFNNEDDMIDFYERIFSQISGDKS